MLKKINRFKAQIFLNKTPQISKKTDFFVVKGFNGGVVNRFSVILSKKNINSAVIRNRLKRFIFISLEGYLNKVPCRDYVILTSPKLKKDFNLLFIRKEIEKLMEF